jgi:ribosomal protein S10
MIKIKLSSVDKNVLKIYLKYLYKMLLKNIGQNCSLIIKKYTLPIQKKIITLNRSPQKHKKSREQFNFSIYYINLIIQNISYFNLKECLIVKPSIIKLKITHVFN